MQLTEIDTRRDSEAKGLGNLLEIQLIHIEDVLQAVRGICLQVRSKPILGRLIQIVVLLDKLLQLLRPSPSSEPVAGCARISDITWDCTLATLFSGNWYSLSETRACLRYRRNPSSA